MQKTWKVCLFFWKISKKIYRRLFSMDIRDNLYPWQLHCSLFHHCQLQCSCSILDPIWKKKKNRCSCESLRHQSMRKLGPGWKITNVSFKIPLHAAGVSADIQTVLQLRVTTTKINKLHRNLCWEPEHQ